MLYGRNTSSEPMYDSPSQSASDSISVTFTITGLEAVGIPICWMLFKDNDGFRRSDMYKIKSKLLKRVLFIISICNIVIYIIGCNNIKTENDTTVTESTVEKTTKQNSEVKEDTNSTTVITEESTMVLENQTIDNIIKKYNDLSGEMHSYEDFKVDRYDSVCLFAKDNQYVFNHHLLDPQNPRYVDGYTYIGDESIYVYVVKVNEGTDGNYSYTPIAALTEIDDEYHNVLVTTTDGITDHESSKHYIYLDETEEEYNDLMNAESL